MSNGIFKFVQINMKHLLYITIIKKISGSLAALVTHLIPLQL